VAWPRRIYVATTTLGVYYTENFVDPSTQPIWTAVNTGLAATDCREFHLDPFDQANRQYVMINTGQKIYRRENGGSWTEILNPTIAGTVFGRLPSGGYSSHDLYSFYADHNVPGRLWALYRNCDESGWDNAVIAMRSDDYGASWSAHRCGGAIAVYGCYQIRSHGDNVYVTGSWAAGAMFKVAYSTNCGATFSEYTGWLSNYNPCILNPLLPDRIYSTSDPQGNTDLFRLTNAGVATDPLQDGLGPGRADTMWFSPTNANHQRVIRNNAIYVTTDEWANVNSPSAISPAPYSFAAWAGADTDQILVGITHDSSPPSSQPHVIGALYGEDDTTAVGIGGANAATSPYTDSIPFTCGGLAINGIAAVDAVGIVHTYSVAMPGYVGDERGEPMPGDRASWETGDTHSDDWDTGDSHHAATTIGTDAAELLELSGQEIQFVAQAANTFLAGPVSGADADPTFRAVVTDDLPAHTHIESDITDLDHTDASAIHDDVAGEIHAIDAKATPVDADELVIEDSEALWVKKRVALSDLPTGASALDDLSDVDAAAPNDGDVLTYDDGSGEWVAAAPTGGSGSGSAASDPVFHVAGALSVATDQNGVWIAPRGATIQYVYIYCRDPGSAGSTIVDVNLNGTSIFAATQANRPTLAYDDADQVAKSGAPDTTALVENDVLSIDIDQVGTDAEDLTVIVALEVTPTDAADITYTPAVAADWDSDVDPGDVDDALDQLAERVDDLEAAGGGGDSTYTAAYASRPAASNAGDLFLPSDGFVLERDTGTAWVPWGPIFPMVPPVLGDFTWVNQGTATADDTYGGIHLLAPAVSGDQLRSLVKSAPATPYSIVACFIPLVFNVNYNHVGILWRQSSDGKLIVVSFAQDGGISINKFSSSTLWNSSYLNQTRPSLTPVWMKLEDNGTNRVVSLSPDGKHWISVHSVSRTDFLTADQVGFYADSNHGTYPCSILLLSWKES